MKAIIFLTIITMSSLQAAPFTLKCKGGLKMRLDVKTSRRGTITAAFYFAKAKNGADKVSLKSGECAWPHRALNSHEPNKLVTEWAFSGELLSTHYGSGNQKLTIFTRGTDEKVMAQNLIKIKDAMKARKAFSIVAPFNSQRGELYIEKVLY